MKLPYDPDADKHPRRLGPFWVIVGSEARRMFVYRDQATALEYHERAKKRRGRRRG